MARAGSGSVLEYLHREVGVKGHADSFQQRDGRHIRNARRVSAYPSRNFSLPRRPWASIS